MSKVIGIDLGTTNSCVSVMENGEPIIIPNSEGGRTTPSVVAFTKDGERIVGEAARRQQAVNPDRTILSIKRDMGSDRRIRIDGKAYTPQEISAMILQKLRRDAESYLGGTVTRAVITVPAYFTDAQRQATKDAGRIAGLEVLRIINEPTSAAFAYGLDHGQSQKILVYDLGGGTFDVSLIEIGDGVIEVLATSGDNHLGGDDFDERLVDYIVKEYRQSEKVDLRKDTAALLRVREAAEKAKRELSSQLKADIVLPFLIQDKNGTHHLETAITRARFDELTHDLVDRTCGPVNQVMNDAGLTMKDLSQVLLVGGSTRIPAVQEMVRRLTGKTPAKTLNPDECVAMGAALQGEKLSAGSGTGMTVSSAAKDVILMDVTPLSLSIETLGGISTKIIDRNTTIPARHSQIFTTAAPFQTSVDIKVLQGERHFARDNKLIGNFRLSGIRRAMAGVPQIEVTFEIDVNGIVKVTAKDLGTGNQQAITISSTSNMSEEEIRRAMDDAKAYEAWDRERKEAVEARNTAESLCFETEQALHKDKTCDKEQKRIIKDQLSDLKKALGRTKPDSITKEQAEELTRLSSQLRESAASLHPEP